MCLYRWQINSVPLGPQLHPTKSDTTGVKLSKSILFWKGSPTGNLFLLSGGDQQHQKITFQNNFIRCLNKCPLSLGTSEGVKFVPSGDELFFHHRGTLCPFPVVTGVGFNFVSSGDEVRSPRNFHIFAKGDSFFGQKRTVGKCKGFMAQWSTINNFPTSGRKV